jgi:UDP-N-acetylmuramyl pentapeptide synthase
MAERVLQLLAQGLIDNVLVKGSRSARMEKVMEPIKSAQAIGHLD